MKWIETFLILMVSTVSGEKNLQDMSDLRWQHRVIVVFDATTEDHQQLLSHQQAVDERDVVWFLFIADQLHSNYPDTIDPAFSNRVRQQYSQYPGQALLIGKDGGIKDVANRLQLLNLFEQIDGMPMRQQEIRQRQSLPKDSSPQPY